MPSPTTLCRPHQHRPADGRSPASAYHRWFTMHVSNVQRGIRIRRDPGRLLHSMRHATQSLLALHLDSAAVYIPHPDKAHTGGEDAHFIMTPR